MATPLDALWIEAAGRLGIPVERGGEAYVHFTGERLRIADDEHLDADDTVAQLVLHELCHALVQGPAHRRAADWGLDNTSNDDEARELACVRLQAHLTGAYGLRAHLYPTTVVRAYFEALPHDALAAPHDAPDDVPARLARAAAVRAAAEPWAGVIHDALARSFELMGDARHPKTRLPLLDATRAPTAGEEARCGTCTWRTRGGMCRAAERRVFVTEDAAACVRWEALPDCLACGACCRSAYDSVTVSARDPVVRRQPSLIVYREQYVELRRAGDCCAALAGPDGGAYRCTIYDDRPRTCRDFERGGRHCLDARRRVGLSA